MLGFLLISGPRRHERDSLKGLFRCISSTGSIVSMYSISLPSARIVYEPIVTRNPPT